MEESKQSAPEDRMEVVEVGGGDDDDDDDVHAIASSPKPSPTGVYLENGTNLRRLTGVDLAVICPSPLTAVGMLGGLERLTAACRGQTRRLQFHFRPEDQLSIPLSSLPKSPSSRLLLRVRVRRDRSTGTSKVTSIEVVGSVSSTFRFSAIADFQYLTLQSFATSGNANDIMSSTKLETVPASFVPTAAPGNYAYQSAKSSTIATQDNARRQGVVIRYGQAIPQGPPVELVNRPRRRSEKYNAVLNKLHALFDRKSGGREMWQRKALEALFEEDGLHAFLELLRVVAYNMSNGPWRGLWVRYGYDPTADPVARYYQVIDVRWKEAGLHKLKNAYRDAASAYRDAVMRATNPTGEEGGGRSDVATEVDEANEVKLFGNLLRRQMVFQLCDLSSPGIQKAIMGLPRKASCTSQGGWFRLEDLNGLRNRIKRYLNNHVTECCRTLNFTPTEGPPLSALEVINQAEESLGRDVVASSTKGKGGRRPPAGTAAEGAAAATARPARGAASRARGGAGGGKRRKGERRGDDDEEDEDDSEEEEEEDYEGEEEEEEEDREPPQRKKGGAAAAAARKKGKGTGGGAMEEEEEEEEDMVDGTAAGGRSSGAAAAVGLGTFLGQPTREVEMEIEGEDERRERRRKAAAVEQDDREVGGDFIIPLMPSDLLNAGSIQLLGGYHGGGDDDSDSSDSDASG